MVECRTKRHTVILFIPHISGNWEVLPFLRERGEKSGKIFVLFCDVSRELFKVEKSNIELL